MVAQAAPNRLLFYFSTAPGMKVLMAGTGTAMFGFLLAHLSGNLLVFAGPARMNQYAALLHSMPPVLWTARLGLGASIGAHIWSSLILARAKRGTRPVAYKVRASIASSYASRTMMWSGPWIAGFVVFHLLQFTTGRLHGNFQQGQPYENLVYSFQSPAVSLIYMVTMCLIGLHLFHGVWSMFQTLGWTRPRFDPVLRRGAVVFGVLITAGFSSVPLAVLTGFIQ